VTSPSYKDQKMNLNLFESPSDETLIQVDPVIDPSVRAHCLLPYPQHPKGCPNAGKSERCPPKAPLFEEIFDLERPVYALINEFDLGGHMRRMAAKHTGWSDRQLRCVLYWQNTARKQLQEKLERVLSDRRYGQCIATWCPEGMGVDVTATLAAVGIHLEWPPMQIARQVALIGYRKEHRE